MMAFWIIVGVVVLLLAAISDSGGGNEFQRKTPSEEIPGDHNDAHIHAKSASYANRCLPCPTQKPLDLHITPELVAASALCGYERFQILGACAPRKCIADRVVKGTVFSVSVEDGFVWAVRDNGIRIGCFPPNVVKSYMEMPESKRYTKVVVASDVNLNDKYGQCFVYPVEQHLSLAERH